MKAILWDLDDTVLDTLPGRMRALSHAYERCVGGSTDPEALWRSHRGGSLEAMGQRLLGRGGPRFVTTYREFYYANPRSIRAYEGVEEILAMCSEREVPMAVVTSKVAYGAIDELVQSGMLKYFQAVIGCDDTDAHKPDPEPIYAALDRLCVDVGAEPEVLFVGDSPADIFAARNAGCRSLAAAWGSLDPELLRDAAPDYFAPTPQAAFTVVASLLQGGDAAWK